MGYETKITVGLPHSPYVACGNIGDYGVLEWSAYKDVSKLDVGEVGYMSFDQVASVDLSKAGGEVLAMIREATAKAKESQVRFSLYGSGDDSLVEDPYGDPLGSLDPAEFLLALRREQAKEPYRRYALAIAVLESMLDGKAWPERVVCVSWGH